MNVTTIDDIKTAVQNSGFNEHFETLDMDEFVLFAWDNMDGMELELNDMFKEFIEATEEPNFDGWSA